MPNPFENFIDIANEYDVDKTLLKTELGRSAKEEIKDFGQDLGETVKNLVRPDKKKPPLKPSGPTPTYQESVLEPKKSGTLYNVTNTHESVPEVTKASRLFKRVNYRFKGFSVAGLVNKGNNDYGVLLGDDSGIVWQNKQGSARSELQATYNVRRNKAELEYSEKNPVHGYKLSVFNDDGIMGMSASYTHNSGLNTVFSADEKSASVKAGLYRRCDNCNLDLSAYATTGEDYKQPFVGVSGRVTF